MAESSKDYTLQGANDQNMYSVNFMKNNSNKGLLHDYDGFIKWIDEVENIVFDKTRLYLLEIQDELYIDHFDDGYTPQEMANIVIRDMLPF